MRSSRQSSQTNSGHGVDLGQAHPILKLAPHITPSLSTLGCSKLLNPPSLWNMQPETKSHKKHLYTPNSLDLLVF
ncbi:hypothetical protein GW17_00043705 [Ensete ventricosum]|nr:hypothetical protein GW17_00043705 [Ensete ventricosum]